MKNVLMTLLLLPICALAESLELESGDRQVTLIELYTSEGCSSCPPADRWISRFVDSEDLWRKVIPLSFHVDYWNFLGWRDRFSDADYSKRQRLHKQVGNVGAVYTPGTLVDGKEWRGLLEGYPLPPRSNSQPGNLKLSVLNNLAAVRYPVDNNDRLTAHVVLIGTGLETQVKRGENSGRLLKHDFVVLDHQTERSKNGVWEFNIEPNAETTAIAAWISKGENGEPIQAVGGWL